MKLSLNFRGIIAAILCLLSLTLSAQMDAHVDKGIEAYEKENFPLALEEFNLALADEASLTDSSNVPKAWYYKGKAIFALMQKAFKERDEATLEKYPTAPLLGFTCFVNALAKGADNPEIAFEAEKELGTLFLPLYQGGIQAQTNELHPLAIEYFDAAAVVSATILDKDQYVVYDVRANSYLAIGDTVKANQDMITALDLFEKFEPAKPDLLIGFMYQRKAFLDEVFLKDEEQALTHLRQGRAALDSQWTRAMNRLETDPKYDPAQNPDEYKEQRNLLLIKEQELLMKNPELIRPALLVFEKEMEKRPEDYELRLTVAAIAQRADVKMAMEVFQKAISVEPERKEAYAELGALHISMAAAFAAKANELEDQDEIQKYIDLMNQNFEKALPFLQKANEIDPTDGPVLQGLITTTKVLEMTEANEKYSQMLKSVQTSN